MNMRKRLRSQGHTILFAGGSVLACGGIYLWSQHAEGSLTWGAIAAYVMIVLGFLSAMIGVFWSICRSMKSKLYQSRRRQRQRNIHVHTIHRPSSFPPSYEESQGSPEGRPDVSAEVAAVVVVDGLDVVVTLAPPLYSQDSSHAPDCTWSWEPPPPYSQVESSGRPTVEEKEEEEEEKDKV